MESLLIIFFILLTSAPLSSPSRSYPHHKPATQSMNRSGFSFPIYHVSHPMVQKKLDGFAPLRNAKTKFLMEVNFGNPMVSRLLVLDTGSDLCWILEGGYNRSASSSLHKLGCRDKKCDAVPSSNCSLSGGCQFKANYLDGTIVEGDALLETFYLYAEEVEYGAPTVEFQMPLGLASSAQGFNNQGVLGLNFGEAGLLSNLPADKFSVCLPDPSFDHSLDSFVRFEGDASLFGECVSFIPAYHILFFVSSIKIAGHTSLSKLSDLSSGAYFIFDTGAEQSYLPNMDEITDTLRRSIKDTEVYYPKRELCYKKKEGSSFLDVEFSFELEGGRLLEMTSSNIWENVVNITTGEIYCLAMQRSEGKNILGLTQMLGKNFGFDRANRSLCYQKFACALLK